MTAMRIDGLIEQLKMMKAIHGNLEVIGADGSEIEHVTPQKYILMSNDHNDIIDRSTSDLDKDYLEKTLEDPEQMKRLVYKGTCIQVY